MNSPLSLHPNSQLDLVLERTVALPQELVWEAWTKPEHLKHWFCPRPWVVSACEIDLRPGGAFNTTMRSPEGDEFPNLGCYLEVVPLERLVFTDALTAGFRPSGKPFMTGVLMLEAGSTGTKYTVMAIHADVDARQKHEQMGFHGGWATALDQLVAYMSER